MQYFEITVETLFFDIWFAGNGLETTTNKYCELVQLSRVVS